VFQAILDEIGAFAGRPLESINLAKLEVVIGGLLGVMLIFIFSSWAIAAVGRTAQEVVWEVRRQFKNRPGILGGTERADYGSCVAIVTRASLREMVKPAVFALSMPILVGACFRFLGERTDRPMLGIEVLAAFLMFATVSGLLMAIFFDNSGGAWDNCKKWFESINQKGSDAHKAAVTGDIVGDPFKDTAGPSLHIIITLLSTTVLVLGPLFIGRPVPR